MTQDTGATPLDDYVAAPDPAFNYTKIVSEEKEDCTTTVYHLVSQTWLDESKVNRPLWEHTVLVTIPKTLKHTKSMMFIGGGNNRNEVAPDTDNSPLDRVAVMTNSIVAQIKQIPNQPLFFVGDTSEKYKDTGREEDELITFGWDKYLKCGDPLWLARLPMTKAVVRAMDLVQKEFPEVDGFFVAGGSKRGWTAWTVAAVDKRVFGVGPAVIDVLNADHYIATLSGDGAFQAEMVVKMGKGYTPAKKELDPDQPEGTINIDAIFSPIKKVNYVVSHARVGQITDYDKLVMEIWTDGSLNPGDAVAYAAKILKQQLDVFINFEEVEEEVALW